MPPDLTLTDLFDQVAHYLSAEVGPASIQSSAVMYRTCVAPPIITKVEVGLAPLEWLTTALYRHPDVTPGDVMYVWRTGCDLFRSAPEKLPRHLESLLPGIPFFQSHRPQGCVHNMTLMLYAVSLTYGRLQLTPNVCRLTLEGYGRIGFRERYVETPNQHGRLMRERYVEDYTSIRRMKLGRPIPVMSRLACLFAYLEQQLPYWFNELDIVFGALAQAGEAHQQRFMSHFNIVPVVGDEVVLKAPIPPETVDPVDLATVQLQQEIARL